MKVVREDIDALNAVLKVEVAPADYETAVKQELDKYRKTAKIPGFRPGTVPFSLVKKQYGKAVLAEELNKLVNKSLYDFIQENKISILGNPIPKEGTDVKGDFDNPSTFEFEYEIGLSPEVKVNLSAKNKFEYNKVKVDDELIGKQIDDLRRRYGKLGTAEKTSDTDMILGQFVELNEDGSIKEGGILNSSTISVEFVEDKATKKSLTGLKVGDRVVVDPAKVSRGERDTAAMLGIKPEQLNAISDKFQITVNEIKRIELAEMNEELFNKLFGEGVVKTEAELKERIAEDLKNMFVNDSDRLLTKFVYQDLMKNTEVQLPDAFMKRWIKLSNEKPITDEQIEADYDSYSDNLKWQLIQGEIFKSNDIKLDNEEVIEFTKGLLVNNYAQYGIPAPADDELTKSAMQVLQNKDEVNRIYDMLAESKLTKFFKDTVKLNEKEISYDDFVALANS
ncbi:trigger factor [Crocinitomicaceae bacterium CZZ-1]|uniref:Trigger factor n=1 Tax=Taishania pollutisoli TaxID=2766479 RepID=A0A8J6PNC1_9FLAO|nr:trigger factor [Taishania pollutisoli]MBC9811478.1 trigger factor [Taishania pollutisoli]